MEKLVDVVAPNGPFDFVLKSTLLVGVYTLVDYIVSNSMGELDGANVPLHVAVTFLFSLPFGIFVMYIMAIQKRLQRKLHALSETDMLTGLKNRAGFYLRAEALFNSNKAIAVLMVDVDHFKSINDTYGHHIGDLALCAIADHLAGKVRNVDVLGRVGGEEFAIVIVDIAEEAANSVSQRVCREVQVDVPRDEPDHGGKTLRITMSVGLALSSQGRTLAEVMKHADAALYEAKQSGRDRVVRFRGPVWTRIARAR